MAFGVVLNRRRESNSDATHGCGGVLAVIRIEHGDYGGGAGGVVSGPLAVNQCALDRLPMLLGRFGLTESESEVVRGIAVELGEELLELFEVNAHLEDKLT